MLFLGIFIFIGTPQIRHPNASANPKAVRWTNREYFMAFDLGGI
jgi:hypothetical protein